MGKLRTMIPANRLSSSLVYADWVIDQPDGSFTATAGYELGGQDININTTDINSFLWRYYYEENSIKIFRVDDPDRVLEIDTIPGITQLSLTFDQSLVPTYTYIQNGSTYLKWYDTTDQTHKVTNFGPSFRSPKVCLDIKDKLSTVSDVLFFYMKNNNQLCVRYQRDRYSTEYVLANMPPHQILRVGVNKLNRVQFLVEELI